MILKYSPVVTVYSSSVASSIQADGSSDEVHQHFGPALHGGWQGAVERGTAMAMQNGKFWWPILANGLKQAVRTIGSRQVSVTVYV